MKACLFYVIFLLIAVVNFAYADTEVGVIFKSNHYSDVEYNESNLGIYIVTNDVVVGMFDNSYNDTTYFLGLVSNLYKKNSLELSVSYGVNYGYGWNRGYADADIYGAKLLLYMTPTLSIHINKFKINTHYIYKGLAWSISYELN